MKAVLVPVLGLALAASAVAQQPTRVDVPGLVKRGKLQEAAWEARERGDTARGDAILARLDSLLRKPPQSAVPVSVDSQGVSYTLRLRHGDSVASIFKVDGSDIFCPACGSAREVAAYRVDRLLGIDLTPMTVPQQVVQNGDTVHGSAMYFIRGARTPSEADRTKPDRLRLFDAIIGNTDRHGGNWLVSPEGRAVAIDHNRAFEYASATRPKTCWEAEVDSIAAPAALGRPYERYRTLPDDSLAAAVSDLLDPALVARFVAMRGSVVERIEQRVRQLGHALPRKECGRDR